MQIIHVAAPLALFIGACQVDPKPGGDDDLGDDETSSDESTSEDESTTSDESTAEDSSDDVPSDLPEEPDEPCEAQDAWTVSDLCKAPTDLFMWDGTQCVELCELDCMGSDCDELETTAEACFAKHSDCIDITQCELGPVGTTDLAVEISDSPANAQAGVFTGVQLFFGPSPAAVGTYLFTNFSAFDTYYPSVFLVETDWTVGTHIAIARAIGSFEDVEGSVTIDSIELEGEPAQWRVRGHFDIDDPPYSLTGPFEVGGCPKP